MLEHVKKIVANFTAAQERKYGVAVCSLCIEKDRAERIIVKGTMLVAKQQQTLDQLLRRNHIYPRWEIAILADMDEPPLGWGYVERTPTHVWSKLISHEHFDWFEQNIMMRLGTSQQASTTEKFWLATQIVMKDEPIKLLWETSDFYCVQLVDRTVGWVRKQDINRYPGFPQWTPPQPKASTVPELNAYIDRWLGVPYLLGGLTMKGIDCSGLTQVVYRHLFNYLLPRHSMEQMQAGRVVENAPKVADLAFFEHHDEKHHAVGHVGVVLKDGRILHACRYLNGKVAISTLPEMIQGGYTFLGYRNYEVEVLG